MATFSVAGRSLSQKYLTTGAYPVDFAVVVLGLLRLIELTGSRAQDTGRAKKFDISGIVADFFTKLTSFADDDSGHLSCKFY